MSTTLPDEQAVTDVLNCAFLMCSARGVSRSVLDTLGEQAGWARRALMARAAIAHAEASGDLDGARALFDPGTPVVIRTEDTGGLTMAGPMQIGPLMEARVAVASQPELDALMDRTLDAVTDDLVKKLGLWVGLYSLQSTQEWDLHHQSAYEYMLARWNLDHGEVSAWWTGVLFPIVGAPDGVGTASDDDEGDGEWDEDGDQGDGDAGAGLAETINQSIAKAEAYLTDPEASEEDKAAAREFLEKVAPQLRAALGL